MAAFELLLTKPPSLQYEKGLVTEHDCTPALLQDRCSIQYLFSSFVSSLYVRIRKAHSTIFMFSGSGVGSLIFSCMSGRLSLPKS